METFIRYCSSLGYFQEVFDLELFFEYNLNECSLGLLGAFFDISTANPFTEIITQE